MTSNCPTFWTFKKCTSKKWTSFKGPPSFISVLGGKVPRELIQSWWKPRRQVLTQSIPSNTRWSNPMAAEETAQVSPSREGRFLTLPRQSHSSEEKNCWLQQGISRHNYVLVARRWSGLLSQFWGWKNSVNSGFLMT
jgi:hypothetical protein